MIGIVRLAEPSHLSEKRRAQLATITDVKPSRAQAHVAAYQSVKKDLVEMQHQKCCYCDRIVTPTHNDVEHHRPFSSYWWLAWNWENLLFACAACNRTGRKGDLFPLGPGSTMLRYPEQPPGGEFPLLLDPCLDDPRKHIQFVLLPGGKWSPIGLTERGRETIKVLDLASDEYITDLTRHVKDTVQPAVRELREAREMRRRADFEVYWRHKCAALLDPPRPFRALSEDVLRHEFPSFPNPPSE